MFQILTKIGRTRSTSIQWSHQLTRSFCYKPVERNFAVLANQPLITRPKPRRRWNFVPLDKRYIPWDVATRNPLDNGRSLNIIASMSDDPNAITEHDLCSIFKQLSVGVISDEAFLHENFNTLTEATKNLLPKLSVTQIVEIFSQITRAKIPMFDELSEIIVNTLLQRISLITVDEIISVDKTVRDHYNREFKLSRVFETMRQATRASFIVKANNELVNNQSYDKLIRMMRYLSNNPSLAKNVDTMSLSKQLLLTDDNEFQFEDVICVIVTLARFPKLDEHTKQLLTKMFRIWCSNTSLWDIKALLRLLQTKKLKGIELAPFNDPQFIQHCSKAAIQRNDITSGFDILHGLNDLKLASTELIDFLSNIFNSDQYKEVIRTEYYATLCIACVNANYKPMNWETIVVPMIKAAQLETIKLYRQVDLILAFNKLGIYHDEFIEHVLKSEEIQVIYKNDTRLDQIYEIYANHKNDATLQIKNQPNSTTYMTWLTSDLEKFIGVNKILNNVMLSKDLFVPLVMKVNTETGDFIEMKATSAKQNLICNKNELIIGVITQDVGSVGNDFDAISKILTEQREKMKDKGWIVITLDESLYGSMQTYKRAFTFFKMVLYAINNRKRST